MKYITIAALLVVVGCSVKPHSVEVPTTRRGQMTNKEYRKAVEKLSSDDRRLLNSFIAMGNMVNMPIPKGMTIGQAIDMQEQMLIEVGIGIKK